MPRPKLCRIISDMPGIQGFRPIGVPMPDSEPVVLLYEEYEALKLMDYKGLTQEESSVLMDLSRPTFTRIDEKARRSVAQAFVEGRALVIEGGHFHACAEEECHRCRKAKTGGACCRREIKQSNNKGENYENCCARKGKCN